MPIVLAITEKHCESSFSSCYDIDIHGVELWDGLGTVGDLLDCSASHCGIVDEMGAVFLDEGLPVVLVVWGVYCFLEGLFEREVFAE